MLLTASRQTLPLFWGKGLLSSVWREKKAYGESLEWVQTFSCYLSTGIVSLPSYCKYHQCQTNQHWPFFNGSLNISLVFCTFVIYSLRVQTMLCVGLYSPLHIAKCSINSRYMKSLDSWTNWLFDRLMVGSPSSWQLSLPFSCKFRIIKELA